MASYKLLIVESPAKCSKIESYLGDGYKCVASFGHIRELDGLKSINIAENFTPNFKECEEKSKQIANLRRLMKGASEVLLASDDDREGEAIAWHICQVLKLPVSKTKRIVFHEITKSALQKAVQSPGLINMDLVNAQIGRQVLDVLVGYKISPMLWKHFSQNTKSGLSAGRCQSPALRLVYDNYKEIESSPGKKVYNTTGYFTSMNLPFVLNENFEDEEKMSEFLEESVNFDHIYKCGPLRNTTKNPPTPFTTSTLQQAANNEIHCSPKETMKICQKLYEAGLITYMRTDSTTYSMEFIEKMKDYINKTYGLEYIKPDIESLSVRKSEEDSKKSTKVKKVSNKKSEDKKKKDESSNAQEAHEAIRPTNILTSELTDTKEFSAREIKMYRLIWRNTMESCMSPATFKAFTALISAPFEKEYKYPVEQVVFKGWKIVEGIEDICKEYAHLQQLKQNIVINYKKIVSKVTLKDTKSHYSEAKLVQLLEQKGIGRPSTFSSLIDKIQEREYVKLDNVKGKKLKCCDYELEGEELNIIETEREFGNEKNKLVIQPLGILVIEFLMKYFDQLFCYDYTKHMEDSLDLIAKGEKVWHELCKECYEQINSLSEGLGQELTDANSQKISIKIDDCHEYTIAKYGPVIKCTDKNKNVTFKAVKPDINIEKLKNGGYSLEELIANKTETGTSGIMLGRYNNNDVYLKNGRYGYYIECGLIKKSIRIGLKKPEEFTLDDALEYLNDTNGEPSYMRKLDDNLSIRNGKYGDYIFYKTPKMKQPKFFKLNGFTEDYKTCESALLIKWIKETNNIKY